MFWDGTRWTKEGAPSPSEVNGRRRFRDWVATGLMFLLLPALMLPLVQTAEASPRLSVAGEAVAGGTIQVVGHNIPRGQYQLLWDGATDDMPTVSSENNGVLRFAVSVPRTAAAGQHSLGIVAAAAGGSAAALTTTIVVVEGDASAVPGTLVPNPLSISVSDWDATDAASAIPTAVPEPSPTAEPTPTATRAPTPLPTSTTTPTATRAPTPRPTSTTTPAPAAVGIDGFGSRATGGTGKPVVLFTNLNDSGPGSLRAALAGGNRYVKPAPGVTGTVRLAGRLDALGDNWTLDGGGAVTLPRSLFISGRKNWIVTNMRFRMASPIAEDAITVKNGATNGVIDHVSISGWTDGAIDVTRSCFDITIQWSIMAEGTPGHDFTMLLGHESGRISVHHNLIYRTEYRNPQGFWNESLTGTGTPTAVTVDFVNNLVWDFEKYATQAARRGWVNAKNNVYHSTTARSSGHALLAETGGRLFQSGNVGLNGVVIDGGTESSAFAVPSWASVSATSALTAARAVRSNAGARPLDGADSTRLSRLSLP
jgi:hypothetical protein